MTKNLKTTQLQRLTGKFLLVIGLMFPDFTLIAQNVTPTVTDGNSYNYGKNGVFVDMSIGELAISTIKSTTGIITQGFHQPIYIEQPCVVPELTYFPNPVETEITITALECDINVDYIEVYDMFGKSVLRVAAVENTIDLSPVGVGVYIIRVYANEGHLMGNLKIIKITA